MQPASGDPQPAQRYESMPSSSISRSCARSTYELVSAGWPTTPNYAVGLNASDDGTAAPQLSLPLVSQLQMSALNPYLARVLGLYFVDTDADPTEEYQYCIVGVSGPAGPAAGAHPGRRTHWRAGPRVGELRWDDDHRQSLVSHLFAWRSNGSSSQPTAPIQGVPADVAAAFAAAAATIAPTDRPPALLATQVDPLVWPFVLPPPDPTLSIALATPVAEVAVRGAGQGEVVAFANGPRSPPQPLRQQPRLASARRTRPVRSPDRRNRSASHRGTGARTAVIGTVASSPVARREGRHGAARFVNVPAASTTPSRCRPRRRPPARDDLRRRTGDVDAGRADARAQLLLRSAIGSGRRQPPPNGEVIGQRPGRSCPAPTCRRLCAQRSDGNLSNPMNVRRMVTATPQDRPPDSPLLPAAAVLRFVDAGYPTRRADISTARLASGCSAGSARGVPWSGDPRGVRTHRGRAGTLRLLIGGAAQSSLDNGAGRRQQPRQRCQTHRVGWAARSASSPRWTAS